MSHVPPGDQDLSGRKSEIRSRVSGTLFVSRFYHKFKENVHTFMLHCLVCVCGGRKALHFLKRRQYSIMCQNRIRGLLELRPVRGKCFFFLPTLQIFSPLLHLAIICSVRECVSVCAGEWVGACLLLTLA